MLDLLKNYAKIMPKLFLAMLKIMLKNIKKYARIMLIFALQCLNYAILPNIIIIFKIINYKK